MLNKNVEKEIEIKEEVVMTRQERFTKYLEQLRLNLYTNEKEPRWLLALIGLFCGELYRISLVLISAITYIAVFGIALYSSFIKAAPSWDVSMIDLNFKPFIILIGISILLLLFLKGNEWAFWWYKKRFHNNNEGFVDECIVEMKDCESSIRWFVSCPAIAWICHLIFSWCLGAIVKFSIILEAALGRDATNAIVSNDTGNGIGAVFGFITLLLILPLLFRSKKTS